jgi:DNA-directed RNA polymerase specialized sigma24 family protein
MIMHQVHQGVKRLIEELPEDQKEVLLMRICSKMSPQRKSAESRKHQYGAGKNAICVNQLT